MCRNAFKKAVSFTSYIQELNIDTATADDISERTLSHSIVWLSLGIGTSESLIEKGQRPPKNGHLGGLVPLDPCYP